MDTSFFGDILSPALVWGYNRKNKSAHIIARQSGYESQELVDYRLLVHPDDIPALRRLIKDNVKKQRRQFERERQVVSLHRVKDTNNEYHPHVSLITFTRDETNRLALFIGVDYQMPADAPLSTAEIQYLAHLLRNATERLTPFFYWVTSRLRKSSKPARSADPFLQTWRCGQFIISPSLFQLAKTDGSVHAELSERQSRFIALLLGACDADNNPEYVERGVTRRRVFGTPQNVRISDNDIDQLVKFFRKILGRRAIGTKRGYGHILKIKRHVCEGEELEQALALL
jgi:hypothetical protein